VRHLNDVAALVTMLIIVVVIVACGTTLLGVR